MSLRDILARSVAQLGNQYAFPELGITEKISGTNQQTQPWVGSVNPNAKAQSGYIQPVFGVSPYTTNNGAVQGVSTSSNPQWSNYSNLVDAPGGNNNGGGGGGGGGNGNNPNSGNNPNNLDDVARAAWERQLGVWKEQAQRAKADAQNLWNTIKGQVEQKRGQFKKMYDEGDTKIAQTFEDIKRQLATNTGEEERGVRARMIASGLGGSAYERGMGNLSKDFRYAAGQNTQQRLGNEKENQRIYEGNLGQADAWDAQNDQSLREANSNADNVLNAGIEQVNTNYGGMLQNIINQAQQLAALSGNIGQSQATPFGVNAQNAIAQLNGLYGVANQGQASGGMDAANLVANNPYDPRKKFVS